MNYLLDTHTFLWTLFDSKKLSTTAYEIISDQANDIYVSTITFWEISLKYSLGKLTLNNITPNKLPDWASKSGFSIQNIDEKIVSTFYKLPKKEHADPFDRLLIWQAILSDQTIITKDKLFSLYEEDGLKSVW